MCLSKIEIGGRGAWPEKVFKLRHASFFSQTPESDTPSFSGSAGHDAVLTKTSTIAVTAVLTRVLTLEVTMALFIALLVALTLVLTIALTLVCGARRRLDQDVDVCCDRCVDPGVDL